MKALFGLSDSLAGVAKNPTKCPQCQTTTRLGRGLCVNCLLNAGLDQKRVNGEIESLDALLDAVNVPDQQWRLGNYEILEEIGRGGMGVIYRARQRHSRRIVAVKRVLSYHADSRETLERFRREAEAAASLDHPNILPIYEVSKSEEGLPYFSMKFATGGSLQDVSHSLRGDARSCVAIVARVARATAYAHGQGILHRDLKPGNILLDGRAEPLVSDFGLAKWLDTTSDLTRTLTTFGTPGYIAPEQAEGHSADLTAAADIYSLGAILFDLLTGRPPFIGEHALSVIRQAAEKPAPKLRSLAPSLDRDLETICARCLEREPQARYHSAEDLADDMKRWLDRRPIRARRVSPLTRVWRLSRRNPGLVGTAAACLLLGAASILLLRPPVPAGQRFNVAKKPYLSPQEAAEQSKLYNALTEYLDSDLEVRYSHLGYTNGSQASMQERLFSTLGARIAFDAKLLREKLPKFAEAVRRDPDAPVYERASAAYLAKDYPEAERVALQAAVEAQKTPATKAVAIIDALNLAAWSAARSSEFTRAMGHLREAEKFTDQKKDPKKWAEIQFSIGNVLLTSDQLAESEKTFREVIDVRSRLFGPEHRQTLRVRRRRAFVLLELANPEALTEYRELVRLDEKNLGPEHPETLWARWDLANALTAEYGGEPGAALPEFQKLFELREKVLGSEHPDTLRTRGALANMLSELHQYAEAIKQRRQLLAQQQKVLGGEDNGTLLTLVNLGGDLAKTGELSEAEAILRQALQLREKTLGPAHQSTTLAHEALIKTIASQGRYVEAENETRNMIRLADTSVGVERQPANHVLLAEILDKQGKHAEAESELRQAIRMAEKSDGPTSANTLADRADLARNLYYQGKAVEAEVLLRELIALNEKVLGKKAYNWTNNATSRLSDDVTPFRCHLFLANALRDQQKYGEAEGKYKEIIELEEKVLGPENADTLNAYYHYAYQLGQQGRIKEARSLEEHAVKGATKVLGASDPSIRKYDTFLGMLEGGHPIVLSEPQFQDSLLTRNSSAERASR